MLQIKAPSCSWMQWAYKQPPLHFTFWNGSKLQREIEVCIPELYKVKLKLISRLMSSRLRAILWVAVGLNNLYSFVFFASQGMVFYSILDVTDKLLAPSEGLVPMLQESFWNSSIQLEPSDPLSNVLEGLCPSAMATFDLASTQCRLWKTCKQLLEAAERRLYNSLEAKG